MRLKAVLFLLLLTSFQFCEGQSLFKRFCKLSGPEKTWTIFHLFKAKKAWKMATLARLKTQEILKDSLLDQYPNGGKADAFRHAYWMALEARTIGAKRAKKLGRAHEKGNYRDFKKGRFEEGELPDSLSSVMDLHNNDVGIQIGLANKKVSEEDLKEVIIKAIKTGEMVILKRNLQGIKTTCDGFIVGRLVSQNAWYLPYCLVRSDNSP